MSNSNGQDAQDDYYRIVIENAVRRDDHIKALDAVCERLFERSSRLLALHGIQADPLIGDQARLGYLLDRLHMIEAEISRLGTNCHEDIRVALAIVQSLVGFQYEIEIPENRPPNAIPHNSIAKMVLMGLEIGALDATSYFALKGHFAALSENQFLRDSRSAGARKTNATRSAWHDEARALTAFYYATEPEPTKQRAYEFVAKRLSKRDVSEAAYRKVMERDVERYDALTVAMKLALSAESSIPDSDADIALLVDRIIRDNSGQR